jgi:hypothetical protein
MRAIAFHYRERLQGFVGIGERNLWRGAALGKSVGSSLATDLTLRIDDWDAFSTGLEHRACVEGTVSGSCLGGTRPVSSGVFALHRPDAISWHSRCTLACLDGNGTPVTIVCVRHADHSDVRDRARQATITYVRLFEGDVDRSAEATAVVRAAGILRTTVEQHIAELEMCPPQGGTAQARAIATQQFRRLMSCLNGAG